MGRVSTDENDEILGIYATQICCLARLLPLMVGEKVEEADSNWRNLLLLISIVDYTFAPVISTTMIAYLKEMIHDHHSTLLEVYSSCPIILRLRYPQWMAKFGPLLRF
uniref:Uncharacterized protein n=1 Tax=Amphimedon queenslandica TaxID=400682 RepID=A0A1X7VSE9_AMPQE